MRSTSPLLQLPQGPLSPSSFILPTSLPLPVLSFMGKQLKFPHHIASTSLHSDMIITSEGLKHLIILELTVPLDNCIKEVNKRKYNKYQELVDECRSRGWRTFYEPIEIGCRGQDRMLTLDRTLTLQGPH